MDKEFNMLADILLNKTQLVVCSIAFRLCEIEFYYNDKNHDDKYVHCHDDQLECGKFYFHKYKNGTYKNGTYKGVDLTLGDRKNNKYFGILIRSIQVIDTAELIIGPCKCVDKILELHGVTDVKSLVNSKLTSLNVSDKKSSIYLDITSKIERRIIYSGPRIGLSDKYQEYVNKPYRYASILRGIKNQKSLKPIVVDK